MAAAGGIENCEILREIQRATDLFFDAECKLLEARRRAADPRSYLVVNQLVDIAATEFVESSEIFSRVSRELDTSLELTENNASENSKKILNIYGYDAPTSYSYAFKILGNVTDDAARRLLDVKFGEGGDESYTLDSMYSLSGAMMRPGGVFRAIAAMLWQTVA